MILFYSRRYDARLLLDALPSSQPYEPGPSSPAGWSDLSSDAEDTFFFNPGEVEDFYREKRRRLLEQTREERLKARMEEDGEDDRPPDEEDIWGGSDEEVCLYPSHPAFQFVLLSP
jgi:hypothetical protein